MFSLLPTGLGADPVALITASRGQTTLLRANTEQNAAMGTQVHVGDLIKTDPHSTIELTFIDKSTLSLAGGAEVLIEDFVFAKGKTPKSSLRVKQGTFSFLAGEIAKIAPERYRIHTDTATIGIRGSGGVGIAGQGLLLATIPGHVLDVWTLAGQHFVLDNPLAGLRVTKSGVAHSVPVLVPFGLLGIAALEPQAPLALPHYPLTPIPYQPPAKNLQRDIIRARPRIAIVEKAQEGECETPSRKLTGYLESESPSARPLLEREAEKLRQEESQFQKQERPEDFA